jgi:gas vesicle protein
MEKILVGVAVGVFVGAMVAEIIRKTNPEWFQKLRSRIRNNAKAAKDAFMEGWLSDQRGAGGTEAA